MMQPSASRSDLILQCSRPFGPHTVVARGSASEAARFGSAWHEVIAWTIWRWATKPAKPMPSLKELAKPIAEACKTYDVGHLSVELEAHLASNLPKILDWLSSLAKKGEKLEVFVEKSFALHVASGRVREIENPTVEDHHYQLKEGEMAGTADLIVLIRKGRKLKRLIVLDHKTGEGDFSRPDKLPQVRTLTLMALKVFASGKRAARPALEAGVFHAFRRGIGKVYIDELSSADLRQHHGALRQAFGRIGDGTMKPGALCKNCPARTGCPAGDSEILVKTEALLKRSNIIGSQALLTSNDQTSLSKEQRLGLLYETIGNGEALASRARDAIKAEMEQGVLPVLSSGKVLTLQKRMVERMSKREFVATYGKLAAERMFSKWRKDKALIAKPETYIQAVDD